MCQDLSGTPSEIVERVPVPHSFTWPSARARHHVTMYPATPLRYELSTNAFTLPFVRSQTLSDAFSWPWCSHTVAAFLWFSFTKRTIFKPRRHQMLVGMSGNVWQHLGASGNVWEHQGTSDSEYLGKSGNIWERLGISGSVMKHLGAAGNVWSVWNVWERVETSGSVWNRLEASGRVWARLGISGSV